MQRTRTLAGTPFRSASQTWGVITTLIADTLERSADVPEGSVATELMPIAGLGAAMVASNILDINPLILVAGDLELNIHIKGGDDAFEVDENLDPVLGGAKAPSNWKLHLPAKGRTADACRDAAAASSHLSVDVPARSEEAARSAAVVASGMDVEALRRMGGR